VTLAEQRTIEIKDLRSHLVRADREGRRVRSRLDSMQTGSPVQLRVIGVIAGVGQEHETALHRRFVAARSHGEWFHPVPELLAYIAENARPS
jgi:hypothetical protein